MSAWLPISNVANRKSFSAKLAVPSPKASEQTSSSSPSGWVDWRCSASQLSISICQLGVTTPQKKSCEHSLTLWTKLDELALTTFFSTLNHSMDLAWSGLGHNLFCPHIKRAAASLQEKNSNKPQEENKVFHGHGCLQCECLFMAWTM